MYYYAQLGELYLVTAVHALEAESTNANYVSITEAQYTSGDIVGKYYNRITGGFDLIEDGWQMGADTDLCHKNTFMPVSNRLDNLRADLNDKADVGHTHSGYAISNHTHTGYATSADLELLEDVVSEKANATHTHSEYASSTHTHSGYATVTALDTLEAEVDTKADATHTHTGYASTSHTHDNYATVTALNELSTTVTGKANTSHTHNYAGSSSAGGAATSANKLNTNAGSATQPVYFANGIPVATTYTLGKSVPSNAVFTDTTYGVATTSANGLMSATDKSKFDEMVLATVSEVET